MFQRQLSKLLNIPESTIQNVITKFEKITGINRRAGLRVKRSRLLEKNK